MEQHSGLFVVFEGGEGGGKSTQVRLLTEHLASQGVGVVQTREPGGTPLAQRLRAILLDPDTLIDSRAEALLYAADRADHVGTVMLPALAEGKAVVCDRYIDSSLVYQGMGRGHGVEEIRALSAWSSRGLLPDLTVVLDLDPEIGLRRAGTSEFGKADRFEQESLDFHRTVRNGFLTLAAAEPARYIVISALGTPEQVATEVWQAVQGLAAYHRLLDKQYAHVLV